MKIKGRKPIPVKIVHDGPMETAPSTPKDSFHMSVRQISNGYIVSRHGFKAGKHFDTEHFTAQAPKIDAPKLSKSQTSRNQRLSRTKL